MSISKNTKSEFYKLCLVCTKMKLGRSGGNYQKKFDIVCQP
jgi:hypothetical protein